MYDMQKVDEFSFTCTPFEKALHALNKSVQTHLSLKCLTTSGTTDL